MTCSTATSYPATKFGTHGCQYQTTILNIHIPRTHLGGPHDPPAFPDHRLESAQVGQPIKDKGDIENKLVPLVRSVFDHTGEPDDLVPPRATGDQSMFQGRFGDDEFGDRVEIDHRGCDQGFRVVRDAMSRLGEGRGGPPGSRPEGPGGGDGEGSFGSEGSRTGWRARMRSCGCSRRWRGGWSSIRSTTGPSDRFREVFLLRDQRLGDLIRYDWPANRVKDCIEYLNGRKCQRKLSRAACSSNILRQFAAEMT